MESRLVEKSVVRKQNDSFFLFEMDTIQATQQKKERESHFENKTHEKEKYINKVGTKFTNWIGTLLEPYCSRSNWTFGLFKFFWSHNFLAFFFVEKTLLKIFIEIGIFKLCQVV